MLLAPTIYSEQLDKICIAFNPICTIGRPRPILSIPKDGTAMHVANMQQGFAKSIITGVRYSRVANVQGS